MSVRKKASLLTDFAMNAYVRDTARTVSRGFFRDKFAGYIIYVYIYTLRIFLVRLYYNSFGGKCTRETKRRRNSFNQAKNYLPT